MKVTHSRVCFIGNDDDIVPKARLISKSDASVEIYASSPETVLQRYIDDHKETISYFARRFTQNDLFDHARLPIAFVYLSEEDHEAIASLSAGGIPYCVIDNLAASRFTTPALIDRAPLTIAIGTEGTAPILARHLKKRFEEQLPISLGPLARVAGLFRAQVAKRLQPAKRRHFWTEFFAENRLSKDITTISDADLLAEADHLLDRFEAQTQTDSTPAIWFVGAGPGDPELLTLQARRLLHDADVVLHDQLVPPAILELCRREAEVLSVGKTGYSGGWRQIDINKLMIEKAKGGTKVIRLKSGDATLFGRLDEETDFLLAHGVSFEVAAGLSSASVGAARMGSSVTRRARNTSYRCLTAHDVTGFTDHNWREMAKGLNEEQFTASVYMGRKASSFLAGRLLMHGASRDITVTIAENISRPEERWVISNLADLATDITFANITGPVILYLGLTPNRARHGALNLVRSKGEAYVTTQA